MGLHQGVERDQPMGPDLLELGAGHRPEAHSAGVDELRGLEIRSEPLVEPAGRPRHPPMVQVVGHLVREEREVRRHVTELKRAAGGDQQGSVGGDRHPAPLGEGPELGPVAKDDGLGGAGVSGTNHAVCSAARILSSRSTVVRASADGRSVRSRTCAVRSVRQPVSGGGRGAGGGACAQPTASKVAAKAAGEIPGLEAR